MARTFVAINDPVHALLRRITRCTPLCPCPASGGPLVFEYQYRPESLPDDYFSLAVFHSIKGWRIDKVLSARKRVRSADKPGIVQQSDYFDAVKLDRRCSRDLRLKFKKHGPGMLAGELLAFGTGTLRARNDDPVEPMHHYLWSRHGRISSRHEVVHGRIRALHWNSLPLLYRAQKESYDSSNVIYGDAYGELEQLWDRRADISFLDRVALSLGRMRTDAEVGAFLDPPLNLPEIIKLHRRCQPLWKTPPASGRALLRRLEHIFANTTIDNVPCTCYRTWEAEPHEEPNVPDAEEDASDTDFSGYDGWLAGPYTG